MALTARHGHRHLIATVLFTTCLLGMIALALGNTKPGIAVAVLLSVLALATAFHFILPGGDFFSAVFANSIGIYACIYVFFLTENFGDALPLAQEVGFALPLAGFLFGTIWRRREIAEEVAARRSEFALDLSRVSIWLIPLIAVGVASFALPIDELEAREQSYALLLAMFIIGLISLLAARSIAAFLLDTANLFEDFFTNAARLVKPAFAFLTCYSLLTIFYGCLFTIVDRYSAAPNFTAGGLARKITLPEGLYFSVVTLSTVGYGDLTPVSGLARIMISSEIVVGVLLLLFGVQAIIAPGRQ